MTELQRMKKRANEKLQNCQNILSKNAKNLDSKLKAVQDSYKNK